MKKISLPSIIFILLVLGYVLTFLGMIIDKVVIAYGLIGIGLYFSPIALVLLILDRVFNKNYDRNYLNKSIIFSIISIIISALMIMWVNSSMLSGLS